MPSVKLYGTLPLMQGSYPGFISVATFEPVKQHRLTFRMVNAIRDQIEGVRELEEDPEGFKQLHWMPWNVPIEPRDHSVTNGLIKRGLFEFKECLFVSSDIGGWEEGRELPSYTFTAEGRRVADALFPEGEDLRWGARCDDTDDPEYCEEAAARERRRSNPRHRHPPRRAPLPLRLGGGTPNHHRPHPHA